MQNIFKYYSFCFLVCQLFSQQTYRSVEDIESEWGGYSSFQKEEMISFCDFLFKEGHYERCLLSSFQLLYKLNNDPIISVLYYYIGRCYEEIGSYELSIKYYNEVFKLEEEHSDSYKAAYYRFMHVRLLLGENEELIKETEKTKDPYLLILQGYAFLQNKNFGDARIAFTSAQSIFNHPHYNKLITPLYQIIEDIGSVKTYNKYAVLISGLIFPGGGYFMLQDYDKGKGVVATFGLLMLVSNWGKVDKNSGMNRFYYSEGNTFPVFNSYDIIKNKNILEEKDKMPIKLKFKFSDNTRAPLLLGLSVLFSSAWYSYNKTFRKNSMFINYYLKDQIERFPPSIFLDFSEPKLVNIE